MIVPPTSTVGDYRTYPLGLTHKDRAGAGALPASLIGGASAPLTLPLRSVRYNNNNNNNR